MTDEKQAVPVAQEDREAIGKLAIHLAATANADQEEHGEWTWRDIAAEATRYFHHLSTPSEQFAKSSPDAAGSGGEALALRAIKAVTATAKDGAAGLSRIMAITNAVGVKQPYHALLDDDDVRLIVERPRTEWAHLFKPGIAGCAIPPDGWRCTRERGHSGPCAAVATPDPLADAGKPIDATQTREAELLEQIAALEKRGAEAVIAYHVAICSPKGVVPDDNFYDAKMATDIQAALDAAIPVRAALNGRGGA